MHDIKAESLLEDPEWVAGWEENNPGMTLTEDTAREIALGMLRKKYFIKTNN
jgi:hypothetical protein